MADTVPEIIQAEPESLPEQPVKQRFLTWHRVALGGILLISIFMDFFQLGQNGFGSYYPAAVRSMMDNWHNFFFVSYDPGGFVTIDKPPVGFWLEVASAKLFGFTPFSVLLPQALAGVFSVLLLYYLVRRHFGVVAGLLAALALALSPISVVTNRNITIDSTLALTLLIGAWAVLRAAETGRLRWLLLSAVIVGIGFNIKMLEAYLVVPAYGLLYLLAAPHSIWKRIGHLALAGSRAGGGLVLLGGWRSISRQPRSGPMLALPRIIRRSALPWATMASTVCLGGDLGKERGQAQVINRGNQPLALPLPPPLETVEPPGNGGSPTPRRTTGQQPPAGFGRGYRKWRLLVHSGSSTSHWEDRLSGSCRWRCWGCLRWPGSDDHACKKTGSSNRWCCGVCGCSRWASSSAWQASSTSTT